MKTSLRAAAMMVWLLSFAPFAAAQGLLVNVNDNEHVQLPRPHVVGPQPREPQANYKIGRLDVQVRLHNQVAQVQVVQSFVNTGSTTLEAALVFPLPYDGAIDSLTLLVDGKEMSGQLLGRDEARSRYEAIVRKNRDPALLEWVGYGMYQTSVFPVPPGATREVTLRYTQLCTKDQGLTDFLFPLTPARYTSQPLDELNVRLSIDCDESIKNVYSPTHDVKIERKGKHATATYSAKNLVPTNDFRLLFDTGADKLAASLLSYRPDGDEDGYFLLLASPPITADDADAPRKTVVFVVDRSSSMSGKKIEQARDAARFVLNNLRDGDLFNIVAYDSDVQTFQPELQKYSSKTREAALAFIDGLYAGGSTNIDAALATALGQIQDTKQPSYVLFLTDGLPTVGEQNEMKIVANAQQRNESRARIIAFGVGYDLNSRLLDKLVRENFGQSEYVRPDENIEDHVGRLFAKIQSPVMTDVEVSVELDGDDAGINRLYPGKVNDLFAGQQLVLAGRYKNTGDAKVVIRGKIGDKTQTFRFPAKLAKKSKDESQSYVAKLWAGRRIGELIDQLDLHGRNQELIDELVTLSTRYGILTPYTSFLADENSKITDHAANARQASTSLGLLERTSGELGVEQRVAKSQYQKMNQVNAPTAASAAPSGNLGGGASYYDMDAKKEVSVNSVQQIGNRSFYRRDGKWVDSTASDEQIAKPKVVVQFSDEFFALVRSQPTARSQFFALQESVLLNLDGQAYLIKPAE